MDGAGWMGLRLVIDVKFMGRRERTNWLEFGNLVGMIRGGGLCDEGDYSLCMICF